MNPDLPDPASGNFYANLLAQIPVLVLRMTPEGLVLAANPEVVRATGYKVEELIGRNFWGLLFPGRLFQQVPKFLAALQDGVTIRDRPMVLHTKAGKECVVSWSRFTSQMAAGKVTEIICTGVDLTQRLIDADRPALPEIAVKPAKGPGRQPVTVEGDMIAPLAISPPGQQNENLKSIGEVQNFLALTEQRWQSLYPMLRRDPQLSPTSASGSSRRTALRSADLDITARQDAIEQLTLTVRSVLSLCRQGKISKD